MPRKCVYFRRLPRLRHARFCLPPRRRRLPPSLMPTLLSSPSASAAFHMPMPAFARRFFLLLRVALQRRRALIYITLLRAGC